MPDRRQTPARQPVRCKARGCHHAAARRVAVDFLHPTDLIFAIDMCSRHREAIISRLGDLMPGAPGGAS